MHNNYVVPYNKYLLLRYNCHINVEIPYGIQALKYLFKYICKGVNRSLMRLSKGDEIEKFINGQYVGPVKGTLKLILSSRFRLIWIHFLSHILFCHWYFHLHR
jgi:hypothetical protein